MHALYSLMYGLGILTLTPRVLWDVATGGRYRTALPERLGRLPKGLDDHSGAIWIHAVSVGEVHAARGILPHLRVCLPDVPVVLSTTTPTGQEIARASGADASFYMPLDLPWALRPYFDALRPRALLLVETEIWPNAIRMCRTRGAPVALINGRLSERSFHRYRRLGRFRGLLFDRLSWVFTRTEDEAERFRRLGIPTSKILVTGNLKADAASLRPPEQATRALAAALGIDSHETLLVAGCTMPGEEELVLDAFARVRSTRPGVRLLLAPRHPERFDAVADLVGERGISCARRSRGPGNGAEVLLLDTIGELPAAYGLGHSSFVGGSLVATGGHNVLEPAVHAQPVLFGPHMENFAALATSFLDGEAAIRVSDAADLARAWTGLLDDPVRRNALGARARRLALADATAGRRTARALVERMSRSGH